VQCHASTVAHQPNSPPQYHAKDSMVHISQSVHIALGLPNHPCALRAARIATHTYVPKSYLTHAVDYSLDLPAEEIPCQMNQ